MKVTPPEKKAKVDSDLSITVNLEQVYKFDSDNLELDIERTQYSNLAQIFIQPRDVFIDFLEIPGHRKDGKTIVPTTRIYLSHSGAQRLAKVLLQILSNVRKKGGIEPLEDD